MRLRTFEYEQIAFVIVKSYIERCKIVKEAGRTPSKFDVYCEINASFPEKYNDDNTTPENRWTKHNENKLKKYVDLEARLRGIK